MGRARVEVKMTTKSNHMAAIFIIIFALTLCITPIQLFPQTEEESAPVDPAVQEKPAELSLDAMKKLLEFKSLENCEKAIKGLEELLIKDPNNPEILTKLADAHIGIIDIKTATLLVEKDEYKPILKKRGKLANDYAEKALKLKPKSKEALTAAIISYGYYSASFGIIKAIFKGAAGKYKDLCKRLIAVDATYLGGVAYRSLGKLYHVAPWPVGSKKKALRNFQFALDTDNSVLYSHYYVGVIHFDKKKYDLAKKEFKFVVENEAPFHEKHFIQAYKDSAQKYLSKIAKKRK
jgi:tetratricopeptide (TPR) repeat protein